MKKKIALGIDLGATYLKMGLVGIDGRIIARDSFLTKKFPKKSELLEAIGERIGFLLRKKRLTRSLLVGIGVGVPGPVDIQSGTVYYFPNMPGWRKAPLKRLIEEKIGITTSIDNDANLMALAELRFGAGRGVLNAVCLTLGSGVGGAVIIDGGVYHGSGSVAGEIGHLPINENGPRCNCGARGCLERYVGNRYILNKARQSFNKKMTLEELSKEAKRGNSEALRIWKDYALHLGTALSGVVNLLNPEKIIIGGGVAKAGEFLFDEVKKIIKKQAMWPHRSSVKVVKARLGEDAGVIGAGILAWDRMKEAR